MAGPLIVTAELGKADFAWLDGLRRRHFPPERNQVPAHLTHVPCAAAVGRGARCGGRFGAWPANTRRRRRQIAGLMNLGGGVAFRVVSPELDAIRDELAEAFHGLLSAQDSGGWRRTSPSRTRSTPSVARELHDVT